MRNSFPALFLSSFLLINHMAYSFQIILSLHFPKTNLPVMHFSSHTSRIVVVIMHDFFLRFLPTGMC